MKCKKILCFLLLCVLVACSGALQKHAATSRAESDIPQDSSSIFLSQWRAGSVVSAESVERFGLARCFVSEEINDTIFARIYKRSYKTECSIPRDELRYIKVLHCNNTGQIVLGEMICNKAIAFDLLAIFHCLYDARYPIERMVLVDEYDADDELSMQADNSSCFNYRYVVGADKLSKHSRGMAVDVNPLYNPCVRTIDGRSVCMPREGTPYTDRTASFPYKIDRDDICYREFTKRGFRWGGDWRTLKDYQHFEKIE